MKPYTTIRLTTCPDKGDIHGEARKSSVGSLARKSGDHRSSWRNAEAKRQQRRLLKRQDKARVTTDWKRENGLI